MPAMNTTTSTTANYGYVSSGALYLTPSVTSGTWTTSPAARTPTHLEWLDAEVERTCALARSAA